jgi:hypothetical protein
MSFQFDSNFLKNNYFGLLKPDTEENLLFYEKETAPNQDPIVYKYNNKGFRCEDFTTDRKGMHILFGGCSETEGAANLLEDVWAKVLYNKIKESRFKLISIIFIGFFLFNKLNNNIYNFKSSDIL